MPPTPEIRASVFEISRPLVAQRPPRPKARSDEESLDGVAQGYEHRSFASLRMTGEESKGMTGEESEGMTKAEKLENS